MYINIITKAIYPSSYVGYLPQHMRKRSFQTHTHTHIRLALGIKQGQTQGEQITLDSRMHKQPIYNMNV